MLTRRQFVKTGAAGAGGIMLGNSLLAGAAMGAQPAANSVTPFLWKLPKPGAGIAVAQPSRTNAYAFTQRFLSTGRQLHPQLGMTQIFAYDDGKGSLSAQTGSFGLAVVAKKGTPLDITYTNALGSSYPSWIPVDTRLTYKPDRVPRTMTHLHGGFVTGANDGNPVITPGGFVNGQSQTAHYPNDQPASMLWFHDHGLGTTRLNVFAGLAAGYLVYDDVDTGAINNSIGIPGGIGTYEIPLVIQDRMFGPKDPITGLQNFLYPTSAIPGSTWIGEYFGDVMLVNGLVWPYLDVEPRKYRLRVLNGCNARIMNLDIGGADMWQIGAEGGMFDVAVPVKQLVLAPAERADVIVDFSKLIQTGSTPTLVTMKNNAPPPPVSTPAPSLTNVMQFRVGATVTNGVNNGDPTTLSLPGQAANIKYGIAATRYITLNELFAGTADWKLNMNGVPFGDGRYGQTGAGAPNDPTPKWNTSEEWQFINMTPDTHPMHTHLFTFKVVKRIPFDVNAYKAAFGTPVTAPSSQFVTDVNVLGGQPVPLAMQGTPVAPTPDERGFKDTVKANPGYITVIQMNFDKPAGAAKSERYVHHCHIVEHEDNDMMRQMTVSS